MLHLKNSEVVELINCVGNSVTTLDVVGMLKREDEEGFIDCTPELLHAFLDGLILKRRGPKDGAAKHFYTGTINNNIILRKLRIAFKLRDTDMVAILKSVGFTISKSELGALFRNKRHENYVKCGDQILRNFLKGMSLRFRPKGV